MSSMLGAYTTDSGSIGKGVKGSRSQQANDAAGTSVRYRSGMFEKSEAAAGASLLHNAPLEKRPL